MRTSVKNSISMLAICFAEIECMKLKNREQTKPITATQMSQALLNNIFYLLNLKGFSIETIEDKTFIIKKEEEEKDERIRIYPELFNWGDNRHIN